MANGSVTMTGVAEFARGVDLLPQTVTGALRDVAERSAHRVMAGARAILHAKLKHPTGMTANHLRVTERDQIQAFIVDVKDMPGRPKNLPLWLERGTVKMGALNFLRAPMEAESASYVRDSERAVATAVEGALG